MGILPLRVNERKLVHITSQHLLSLPQQSTRFDAANDELWVNNNGPMRTGDYVTLGGGPSTPASSEEATICDSTSKIEVTGIGPWKAP